MSRTSHQNSVRQPLGDASQRINNIQPRLHTRDLDQAQTTGSDNDILFPKAVIKSSPNNCNSKVLLPQDVSRLQGPEFAKDNGKKNRDSTHSAASTSSGSKLKSCIGPWKLGKTLGKGSTARVRLARHVVTGQEVAVKIVQKASAQMLQSGSLANFERAELNFQDENDRFRRMPAGIEREVAIMKLIQHPNILKLYDIWENRKEIYLCLEYVDDGELFEHIAIKGRLREDEAIKYFRQILSAVGYCHSFNICHRDLKPENILLTSTGRIKIADFGMAALHQTPDHQLSTSCGSPHYAAPELIMGSKYRGNLVDIWSMGVILYATLSGRLPFDVEGTSKRWLGSLLNKIKRGQYEMDADFSPEVKDLIEKMLQVNPNDRITLKQIWQHPLLIKYDYLDDFGRGAYALSPNMKGCGYFILQKADVNMEIFRHLRSMWHTLSEQKLMAALLSEKSNDQKIFYALLVKFRDEQLENYMPNVSYSPSDYHHVKPLDLTKTFSTCRFPRRTNGGNHQRQISRFTVISNTAESIRSYDPYKASCPQKNNRRFDGARVVIYRDSAKFGEEGCSNRLKARQTIRGSDAFCSQSQKLSFRPKIYLSRSSLANSTRSCNSLGRIRAPVGRRRGVSFRHLSRARICDFEPCFEDSTTIPRDKPQHKNDEFTNKSDLVHLIPTDFVRSKKRNQSPSFIKLLTEVKDDRLLKINEDIRVHSRNLAKDCDEAFNASRISKFGKSDLNKISTVLEIDARPLPQPPARSESLKIELIEARKQAEIRKKLDKDESATYLNRLVTHIDKLMQTWSTDDLDSNRRVTSAPIRLENLAQNQEITSINASPRPEAGLLFWGQKNLIKTRGERTTSAPERRRGSDLLLPQHKVCIKDTIRFVQPESASGHVMLSNHTPFRRKRSWGGSMTSIALGRGAIMSEKTSQRIEDACCVNPQIDSSTFTSRKKLNWFRRVSKEENISFERESSETQFSNLASRSLNCRAIETQPDLSLLSVKPIRKVSFVLKNFFKKKTDESPMSLEFYNDDLENDSISRISVGCGKGEKTLGDDDQRARRIAPLQSWFAKLFNMKPTAKFICFSVMKKKARRETVALLKEWRCYGIQDIQVDQKRDIIFGKVGVKNYLNIKEVSFAAEFMTVIEHGRRSTLSIARWTQEQGAASSFQKVVETLEIFLKLRNLLLSDERKKKMMIKTVKSLKD